MDDRRQDLANGLKSRYAIERELGYGGMATVWLARDLRYDRLVALKVLRPELAVSLGAERFLREIMLAARLQHPHIVSVYDSGEIETAASPGAPILWFAMPYVEGESLRERLRRQGALPRKDALRIAREACRGLQYAHDHGVIHRDVKPENILLTRDGSTLVADFGIARPTESASVAHLTATGSVVGTPAYMSPEQALGADLDARTDIYSLGCVLYEMLTGEPPFTGLTVHAIVARHISEQPTFSGEAASSIPNSVRPALTRALAKSPADRQASAAELAEQLAGTDAPVADAPKRRWLTAAGAVLVGGLIAMLVLRTTESRSTSGASGGGMPGGTVASGFARRLAQLTFGAGLEEWPAWSPDGTLLAYVAEVDGYRQLFVRPLAGGERSLTEGRRDHIQPAWSPDGERLAFVRGATAAGKLEPSEVDGYYFEGAELWTLEVASGRETKLLDNGFNPSYSPDGGQLAFDALLAGGQRVWITDARGRNPRQLTSDSSEAVVHTQPRWSPDGTKLVFRRIEKTKSDIAVVDVGNRAIALVTDDYLFDTDPTWSPDGRTIYFSSNRGGGLNVWRVPVGLTGAPTGPAEQLTTGAGDDVQADLAPDGRRLVFAVLGSNSDLWRLPVSPESGRTTGMPEPVLATTRVESRGSWAPDGKRIAFNSDRTGEMNLWVRDSGGRERQVTSGPGGDYQPTWSPDGSALVFFSARGGNTDIWRVGLADSSLTRLTDDRALDTNPFPSPDGRHIAFVSDRSGRSEVWLMNADGSGQRQLASVGCWGHFLIWTRDGRGVVFRGESERQIEIYRVDIASGERTTLPPVMSGAHMSFSPAQSLIMDVRSHKVLWAYPVDGRPPYQIYQFPDPDVRIDYPVWSPDGRSILFDRATPRGGDLWALEGF